LAKTNGIYIYFPNRLKPIFIEHSSNQFNWCHLLNQRENLTIINFTGDKSLGALALPTKIEGYSEQADSYFL